MSRRVPAAVVTVLAGLAAAVPGARAADAVPGQLIVGFKGGAQQRLVERAGGRLVKRYDRIGAALVKPRQGSTRDLRDRLRRLAAVRYAEPDFYLRKSAIPDDPFYVRQWGEPGIVAPTAWDVRTSCAKVAVLDSGVQAGHPDLKGNVWHNPDEIKDNGKDDDHNGYVDDYYGVNIPKGSGSGGDGDGHGTHVSGIIAGQGNNGMGVAGTCWTGSIMPVRFMNDQGRGSTSDAIEGMDYAIHEGAKVINCSFGSSSKSSSLSDMIDKAKSKNVLLVVAAGNDGDSLESHPEYPASYTQGNILTVAALDSDGGLASFSNYGSKSVDLAAPGDSVYSTYPTSTYKYLSGTSMAAPFVSAAAAMLRKQDSNLSYSDIRSTLKASVDADPALSSKTVTGGRLDIASALARVR